MANFWLLQPKIKPYQKSFTRNWKRMGVIFHSLLVTHWNSLVAHYSLQNHSLLDAEVAGCKKSLATRCKICSLLVAEVARCKISLLTSRKILSLLVAEIPRCKKSLVTRGKICLLRVAEVARCKKLLVTRYGKNPGTNVL